MWLYFGGYDQCLFGLSKWTDIYVQCTYVCTCTCARKLTSVKEIKKPLLKAAIAHTKVSCFRWNLSLQQTAYRANTLPTELLRQLSWAGWNVNTKIPLPSYTGKSNSVLGHIFISTRTLFLYLLSLRNGSCFFALHSTASFKTCIIPTQDMCTYNIMSILVFNTCMCTSVTSLELYMYIYMETQTLREGIAKHGNYTLETATHCVPCR